MAAVASELTDAELRARYEEDDDDVDGADQQPKQQQPEQQQPSALSGKESAVAAVPPNAAPALQYYYDSGGDDDYDEDDDDYDDYDALDDRGVIGAALGRGREAALAGRRATAAALDAELGGGNRGGGLASASATAARGSNVGVAGLGGLLKTVGGAALPAHILGEMGGGGAGGGGGGGGGGSNGNGGGNSANGGRRRDKSDRATVEQAIDPRTRMVLFKLLNRGALSAIHGCVSTGKEANVYHAVAGPALAAAALGTSASMSGGGGSGGGTTTPAPTTINPLNPLHAAAEGRALAVKIYKTSILVFRDRERYVSGDFRFQQKGYCRSNPRKMVATWAEKEARNLARVRAAGIRAPAPLLLRSHVLLMEFVGDCEQGVAAPRLRDAGLPQARLREAYYDLVVALRRLYQDARLVHADLSEYNVLVEQVDDDEQEEGEGEGEELVVQEKEEEQEAEATTATKKKKRGGGNGSKRPRLVLIDVSQSVDLDHPKALDFLREDCRHVNDFFRRAGGVAVLTGRELFDFVVDPTLAAAPAAEDAAAKASGRATRAEAAALSALMEAAASRPLERGAEAEVAEAVFHQAFIPRRLDEVAHYERDRDRAMAKKAAAEGDEGSGEGGEGSGAAGRADGGNDDHDDDDEPYYVGITGMAADLSGPRQGEAAVLERLRREEDKQRRRRQKEEGGGAPSPAAAAPRTPAAASGSKQAEGDDENDEDEEDSEDDEDEDDDESDEEEGEDGGRVKTALSREEEREARKAHKRAVKEANRERRKTKTPKHVKKRAERSKSNKKR